MRVCRPGGLVRLIAGSDSESRPLLGTNMNSSAECVAVTDVTASGEPSRSWKSSLSGAIWTEAGQAGARAWPVEGAARSASDATVNALASGRDRIEAMLLDPLDQGMTRAK